MGIGRTFLAIALSMGLAACGGGDGETNQTGFTPNSGGGTSGPALCSLRDRQDWALAVLDEWYLFPDLLDRTVNPDDFSTVQDYLDALVAPARAQNRDQGFTFITSASEEDALINSGSSAGFGIRLAFDSSSNRLFILEAFENAPAFGVGMDRGTEILAIGTSSSDLQTISSLFASGGTAAINDALGPSDPGVTRVIQFRTAGGVTMEQIVTKEEFPLDPISDRYGIEIINDGGRQIGYLNLRTFIVGSADGQLRDVFQQFRDAGINELIIDFRYNGGGLVRIATLMGDLLNAGNVNEVWSQTVLRESKSDENETTFISPQSQAISSMKIAFIGRQGTASASELVINSMLPYLDSNNIALIGTNTSGKPVGQFGFDRDECDDRLRAVTFQTLNANDEGDYFNGIAEFVPNTCRANDDIFNQLGDPNEASVATALDFLAGRSCNPILGGELRTAQSVGRRELMQSNAPNAAQLQVPGLF